MPFVDITAGHFFLSIQFLCHIRGVTVALPGALLSLPAPQNRTICKFLLAECSCFIALSNLLHHTAHLAQFLDCYFLGTRFVCLLSLSLSPRTAAGRHDALASFIVFQEYSIFVGNLPFDIEENDLRTWFSEYGTVNRVNVVLDPRTKRSKGTPYPSMPFALFAVLLFFAAPQRAHSEVSLTHRSQLYQSAESDRDYFFRKYLKRDTSPRLAFSN